MAFLVSNKIKTRIMQGGIDFLSLGLVGREHFFAECWCLGIESHRDMSWILLSQDLEEHRHKTAGTGCVLARRGDEVVPNGKPRAEDDRVAVD